MKRKAVWVMVGLGVVLAALCVVVYALPTPPVDEWNACTADDQCVLVRSGMCGTAESIHQRYLSRWNFYRSLVKLRLPLAVCSPQFPAEWYQPRCINTRCDAFMFRQHATLIFSEPPALNLPSALQFAFRNYDDVPEAQAWVELPAGLELLSGEVKWQGELRMDEEQSMDLVVVANQPGYYVVKAAVFSDQDGHFSMSDEVYVEIDEQGTVFPGKPLPYWDLRYAYPMPENNALVSTELLIEPEPALGSQFDLIFRATPLADMTAERALQITVALPREGLKLLSARFPQGGESHQMSDQVNWQGTAVRGQTVELRLRLQVDQTGWGQVIGMLHGQTNAPNPQRVTDTLIAEIFAGEHQGSYSVKRP